MQHTFYVSYWPIFVLFLFVKIVQPPLIVLLLMNINRMNRKQTPHHMVRLPASFHLMVTQSITHATKQNRTTKKSHVNKWKSFNLFSYHSKKDFSEYTHQIAQACYQKFNLLRLPVKMHNTYIQNATKNAVIVLLRKIKKKNERTIYRASRSLTLSDNINMIFGKTMKMNMTCARASHCRRSSAAASRRPNRQWSDANI